MKRFAVMSITLILVGALVFAGSLWFYFSSNKKENDKKSASSQKISETAAPTEEKKKSQMPDELKDSGIFSDYYEQAYQRMLSMTLEEKIGQLLLAESPAEGAENLVLQYNIGGIVFTEQNFDYIEKKDAQSLVSGYEASSKTPLILAVTEIGGENCAVSSHYRLAQAPFASPRELFANGGLDEISDTETQKAAFLKEFNINTNLAPVCDISVNEGDKGYAQSLGQDAATTKQFVSNVTRVSQNSGVSVALKNFPGYKDNGDAAATDKRDYIELEKNELSVFKGGIEAGAHFVMLSNTVVTSIDGENTATLSPKVIYKLKNDLGFTGVTLSAKLEDSSENGQNVAVSAIKAGCDMVYVTDAQKAFKALLDAVNDNSLSQDKIERACFKVLSCKFAKGLM